VKKLRGARSSGKSARRLAHRARRRARFGAPDASLTGSAGVLAVGELMDRLGVIEALDAGIGPIKTRALGVTGGELVASLAQCQLLDGKFVAALDRHRADAAAQALSAVPAVASTTAGGLTRCFGPDRVAGIEAGNTTIIARGWERLGEQRRAAVLAGRIGIDLDATDVQVYGRRKRGVAYNYLGQRAGRPHLATWADTGLTLAADLLTGVQDVRAHSSGLLGRAVAALPAEVRDSFSDTHRPVVRADAGYFVAELAHTAVGLGCDFAVAAKRNPAMWRAAAAVPEQDWSAAHRMTGAQVAVSDYAPAGWPPGTYTIIRRVRVDAADISTDPRSRRRRTIDRDQLALVLDGAAAHGWATSFIVTNLPTGGAGFDTATDVEAWFRMRTDIEDRIREAKLGAGLIHLPSGYPETNTVWMWAALLAGNLSTLLQALTGIDTGKHGRAHGDRLRHQLLRVPARVIHHARELTLRLPPGHTLLPEAMADLRALPAPSG